MKKRGQVFTGAFTWVLIGMLLLIAVTTVVFVIYLKSQSQPTIIYIVDNTTNETTPPTVTPIIPIENITTNLSSANASSDWVNITELVHNITNITTIINVTNNSQPQVTATLLPANCSWNLPYPDYTCTPGVIMTKNVTLVCTPGYATSVRNVTQSTKDSIYKMYGVSTRVTGEWQIDHLVPLSLGGSNDIRNLWPEPSSPYPGYYQKDKVERYLYQQVCDNRMTLETAQLEIAHNWVAYINSAGNIVIPADYNDEIPGDQIIG